MNTIACSLNQEDQRARRERWVTLGSRALVRIDLTLRGLQLVFADEPGVAPELRELAELERDCCTFASWTVLGGEDRVVLDIAGNSDDAVPAVQAMFGALREMLAAT